VQPRNIRLLHSPLRGAGASLLCAGKFQESNRLRLPSGRGNQFAHSHPIMNRKLLIGGALFRELALARADGSLRHFLARLARIEVLVIDDWAMAPLNESERREVWEICEDRYQTRSTVLTSQLPVSRWHEQIGDPTIADGILDRLVHNAHRIDMRGESMRKNRNPTLDEKKP
jgi:hypothetical protein